MYNILMKNFSMTEKLGQIVGRNSNSKDNSRKSPTPTRKSSNNISKGTDDMEEKHVKYTVDISLKTILMILAVATGLYLGYRLLVVIGIIFFAFAIASAILPIVRSLIKKGWNKSLSIVLVYLAGLILLGTLIVAIVLPIQQDLGGISSTLGDGVNILIKDVANFVAPIFGNELTATEIVARFNNIVRTDFSGTFNLLGANAANALGAVGSVASFVGYAVFSIVISAYIVYDHDSFQDLLLLRIIDDKKRKLAKEFISDIEVQLGSWLRGQVILSFVIGLMGFVMLKIFGIKYALPFALLLGALEIIPTIGPVIGSVPGILMAFIFKGPIIGIAVTVCYYLIQWLENNFIVPRVMGNATGLKPIVVMLGVFGGFTLLGPVGAILAVPTIVVFRILYDFYIRLEKINAEA